MALVFVVAGIVLGAIVGGIVDELASLGLWGAVSGGVAGYLWAGLRRAHERNDRLQSDVERLLARFEPTAPASQAVPAAPSTEPAPRSAPSRDTVAPVVPAIRRDALDHTDTDAASKSPPVASAASIPRVATPLPPLAAAPPMPPDPVAVAFARLRASLLGGNTVVRVGVLVLLVGIALLARYAIDHSLFPVELRLATTALIGVALVTTGWRLRERRKGYATILQGGGIGTAYLTVFFALRVYDLVPPLLAFPLLVLLTLFSGMLAVLQDALSLAIVSTVAGFAAPVVASTGAGSHVALFSYYLLLNGAILGVALFRSWRPLNLLGFAFTFGVASAWGALRYEPQHFATTEPFLAAFFLFYVAIALLFAWRQPPRLRGFVDGTLVFGTPLAAFSLQTALLRGTELGLAWSALALALFYLGLGSILLQRAPRTLRAMVEAFVAIGIGFGTLAVPLGLDNHHLTATTWALEGTGLLWVGVRQKRLLARLAGMLLQLGAAVAFAVRGLEGVSDTPLANSRWLGCMILALSGLFTAWYLHRSRERVRAEEIIVGHLFLVWGLVWWLIGGTLEISAHVEPRWHVAAGLGFIATTALGLELVARRLTWPEGRAPALLLIPGSFVFLLAAATELRHPFAGGGLLAWPAAIAVARWLLWRRERSTFVRLLAWLHAGLVWIATALLAWEATYWVRELVGVPNGWSLATSGLVSALVLLGVANAPHTPRWLLGARMDGYLFYGAAPVVAYVLLWGLAANLNSTGDPWPLPYLPLAGPLDIAIGLGLVATAFWHRAVAQRYVFWSAPVRQAMRAAVAFFAFIWLNAILARSVHHWAGVPFDGDALFASVVMQTAVSITWTLVALAVMLTATHRGWRTLWIVGATLIGAVVVKLFIVDLSALGTGGRILSFLVVGALLLLVGYFSPVPPRQTAASSAPDHTDVDEVSRSTTAR